MMSAKPFTATGPDGPASAVLRGAGADRRAHDRRAHDRLATAIDDISLPTDYRLDDRTRATVDRLVEATVQALEREIAVHAARLMAVRGATEAAARLSGDGATVLLRLIDSRLLRDTAIMAELIGQARIDLLDEALIANRPPDTAATLLPRLAESGDGIVRQRAIAYLVADSRRRLPAVGRCAELPVVLYRRLAWWVTAVLRERLARLGGAVVDQALVEATERSIAAYDEEDRVEASAVRLAAAIAAPPGEQASLMQDALVEGRSALFVAALAHALGIDPIEARGLTLDGESDRLWLALRSLDFERDAIARVGWLLCEADPTRDVERLADAIDPVAALSPAAAAEAVTPLSLSRDFHAAIRALAGSRTE